MKRIGILVLLPLLACSKEEPVQKVAEKLAFSPAELDFGDVPVMGGRSMRFEVVNGGQAPLTLHVDSVDGPFEVEPEAITLAATEIGAFTVRFRPVVQAEEEGAIRFLTGGGSRHTYPVRGSGVDRVLVVEPETIDFGEVRVGATERRNFTIRSTADGALDLRFRQRGSENFLVDTAPFTISGGGEVSLEVGFTPTAIGGYASWLEISPCPDCSPVEAHFVGLSAASLFTLQPDLVDLGRVPLGFQQRRTVAVRNGGTTEGEILGIRLDTESDFLSVEWEDEFPQTIRPGEIYEFQIHFRPTEHGNFEGTVQVQTSEGMLVSSVKASAGGPILAVVPGTTDFGELPIEMPVRRMIQVENIGDPGNVNIVSAEVEDPDSAYRIITPFHETSGGWAAEVELLASDGGEKAGILRVKTNLPLQSELEIPLHGAVLGEACNLVYDPPAPFRLGLRDRQEDTTFTLRVSHRGKEPCLAWNPRFYDPSFQIVAAPGEDEFVRMEPDEVWEVRVHRNAEGGFGELPVTTFFQLSHSRAGVTDDHALFMHLVSPMPVTFKQPQPFSAPVGRQTLHAVELESTMGVGFTARVVDSDAFIVLPPKMRLGSGATMPLPVVFSPTWQGKQSAWIHVEFPFYAEPFIFRVEGEGTPGCKAPCDWPSVRCDYTQEDDLIVASGEVSPEGVRCAWSMTREMPSGPPQSNWPSSNCEGFSFFLPTDGSLMEVGLIAFEDEKAAVCGFRVEP